LITALRGNPGNSGAAVEELCQYFADRLEDLFEEHNGELYPLREDPAEWTEDYLETLLAQLMENFSEERFNHALQVGAAIGEPPQSGGEPPVKPSAKRNSVRQPRPTGKARPGKEDDACSAHKPSLGRRGIRFLGGPVKLTGYVLQTSGDVLVKIGEKMESLGNRD